MAFAICEEYGQVTEFSDDMIEERLGVWARATGFHAFCAKKPNWARFG